MPRILVIWGTNSGNSICPLPSFQTKLPFSFVVHMFADLRLFMSSPSPSLLLGTSDYSFFFSYQQLYTSVWNQKDLYKSSVSNPLFPMFPSVFSKPHQLHQSLLSAHPASLVHSLESTFTSWANESTSFSASQLLSFSTKLRGSSQSFQHNPKFIHADATIPILGKRFSRLHAFCNISQRQWERNLVKETKGLLELFNLSLTEAIFVSQMCQTAWI